MATSVGVTRSELDAAQAVLLPQIEGLQDFARLNIQPDTLTAVQTVLSASQRRSQLIAQANAALEALQADGYPDVSVTSIPPAAYDDLTEQLATEQAALTRFAPAQEAVAGTITFGTPEPK